MRRPHPGRLLVLALLALMLPATPALADPAGPTDYRTTLAQDTVGVATIEVFGGDSFLVLHVPEGHTALVHGYQHRPQDGIVDNYLRFDADGTVWVNERSESRYANEDRYAFTTIPDDVGADFPPEWTQVGSGGSYAWHDHRIHWMSPQLPPSIDTGGGEQVVQEFTVPITVDGEELEVVGTLAWLPPPSPAPWLGLAAVVLVAGVIVAGRRPTGRLGLVAVGALAFLVVGLGNVLGLPAGVPAVLPPVLLALAAAVVLGASRLVQGRSRDVMVLAAGLPVLVGAATQLRAVTASLVPSTVPEVVVRTGVTIGGALALAAAVGFVVEVFGQDLGASLDEALPEG